MSIQNSTIILCLASALLQGCSFGFKDVALNQSLPDDFKYRTILKNSIEFRSDPGSNIGLVISPDEKGQYHIIGKPILPSGVVPQVSALKDGNVYDSKVDAGASSQGSYLAFAATLSVDQTASVDIVDAVHAYVPPADIPDDSLFAIAATHSATPRYWLEDLYISTVTKTVATKESGNVTASPPAFGAKGSIYGDDSETSHDWIVAARLINVDTYALAHGKPANGPIGHDEKLISAPTNTLLRPGQNLSFSVLSPITFDMRKK
ncbi:hypothetical protein [Burkholderia contaminans]|uniref:Uncharacterized protein n=1 Tax=Burkholderia contaminans TaxID=488447 RepID=A0AAP4RAT1_9BURK|nr:hypothetical protein [Burkholderia contaminans]MDN7569961.1 hypothetical protein [Burkholderia contaminans]